jgi:hypothetical protein
MFNILSLRVQPRLEPHPSATIEQLSATEGRVGAGLEQFDFVAGGRLTATFEEVGVEEPGKVLSNG